MSTISSQEIISIIKSEIENFDMHAGQEQETGSVIWVGDGIAIVYGKIMAEVLPYKNVFPAGGAAQDLETNLSSQEEGIISGTATEDPNAAETPAETTPAPEGGWANYDEEFIDSGDEYSYPDTMGNVQDESAAVGNGETAGTGRDTGTADNVGETAASQEAQAAGD